MPRNKQAVQQQPTVQKELGNTAGGVPVLPSVLVICQHFPPLNRTAARRPYYLARHLTQMGHNVSVVTQEVGPGDDWNTSLQGMHLMRLPVTHSPHSAPSWQRWMWSIHWRLMRTPLRPLMDLCADLFLPLNPRARLDITPHAVEQQLGRHDVVVATGPGWSMFEFGAQVSRAWNSVFLPDYRDPWSVEMPEVGLLVMSDYGKQPFAWLRKRRMRRLERKFTEHAHGITAATPPFLENALRMIGERPSAVVFNGHEATHHPLRRAPTERFTLVYTGSVYWEQEWEILADALRQLRIHHPGYYRDLHVQLIGATSSHGPTMARVQHLIDTEPCVSAMIRMDRTSTIRAQGEADRLLHVGFKGKKGIVPLKFLEYVHAGVPVIQVSSTRDLQETILEGTRTGIVAPDASTLLNVMLEGIAGWRAGRPTRHDPDKAALEEYTWGHQMERWRQFILTVHRAHKGNGTATS